MHHFMVSVAVRSSGRRTAQVEEMFASFLGAVVQEVREGRGLGNPTNFSSMILRINMSSASSLGRLRFSFCRSELLLLGHAVEPR